MERKTKELKYIRAFFITSLLTVFFFLTSFGPIFYNSITDNNPPHTDNGLGMAYAIFSIPIGLTLLLLLACINFLYLSKDKGGVNTASFVLTAVLAIPVFIFGLLMLFFTLLSLTRLLN